MTLHRSPARRERTTVARRTQARWALAYLGVTLVPLGVILLGPMTPRRGFWIEFGVALGFIGLAMMGLQSILTARLSAVSAAFGQDTLLQFHRQAGIVAFVLILSHPVILLTSTPAFRSFLDPGVNLPRAFALGFVIVALVALIVTSLWRQRLGIPYEWWRLGHGALATVVLSIGMIHIVQVHHYQPTYRTRSSTQAFSSRRHHDARAPATLTTF